MNEIGQTIDQVQKPPQAEPPPEKVEAANKWKTMLSDPKMQATLLAVGVSLLRDRAPGQSTGDKLAKSVLAGGGAYGALASNEFDANRQLAADARSQQLANQQGHFQQEQLVTVVKKVLGA